MPLILITGSGTRIGRGLALLFADRGWDVLLHYFTSEDSVNNLKHEILNKGNFSEVFQADLRFEKNIKKMFSKIKEFNLVPDVLINNAGVFPKKTNIQELTEEQWNDTFNINLKSAFLTSKEFASIANKNAHIVNIASLGGLKIWKDRIDYNVSKSALIQLSKALARAFAPNIIVNTVCPGYIDFLFENNNNYHQNKIDLNKIPMQRYGNILDVFEAVYFFSTCSNFITGQQIVIDGGQSLIN